MVHGYDMANTGALMYKFLHFYTSKMPKIYLPSFLKTSYL